MELLRLAEADRGQALAVDGGELAQAAAVRRHAEQLDRRALVVEAEDQPVPPLALDDHRVVDVPAGDQLAHLARRHVDGEQRIAADVGRGGVEGLAVGGEDDPLGRAVPRLGEHPLLARGPVAQDDVEAVRLVARPRHPQVGEGLAVGGEDRLGVPRRIGRGQVARRAGVVDRHRVEVEVGRPGLLAVLLAGQAGGEDDRVAVGGEGELLGAAEGAGGDVGPFEGARQVVGLVPGLAVRPQRGEEELVAQPLAPGVPVADETAVVELPGRLPFLLLVEPPPGAAERPAVGEDLEAEGEVLAVGRDGEVRHVEREMGHLHRLPRPGHRRPPDLRRAGAAGEEVEALAVGRPARVGGGLEMGEPAEAAAVQADQPDVVVRLVGREVGGAHHEGHAAAVGGRLRVGEALHRMQVVGGEGVGRRLIHGIRGIRGLGGLRRRDHAGQG